MRRVVIRGDGIAACCCARLLDGAGFRVVQENGSGKGAIDHAEPEYVLDEPY